MKPPFICESNDGRTPTFITNDRVKAVSYLMMWKSIRKLDHVDVYIADSSHDTIGFSDGSGEYATMERLKIVMGPTLNR